MLFQIESDRFESAYADLLERIQTAMQETYDEEKRARGLTKTKIAAELNVDLSVVSRRLNGAGNITLRSVSDMYTAMGREPLSNFSPPSASVDREIASDQISSPSQSVVTLNPVPFTTSQPLAPTPPLLTAAISVQSPDALWNSVGQKNLGLVATDAQSSYHLRFNLIAARMTNSERNSQEVSVAASDRSEPGREKLEIAKQALVLESVGI
jgi:hypothetical protein